MRGHINHSIKRHGQTLKRLAWSEFTKRGLDFKQRTAARVGDGRIPLIGESVRKIFVLIQRV